MNSHLLYTEGWNMPFTSFVHKTAHASDHNRDTKNIPKHRPIHIPSIQYDYRADIAFAPSMRCPANNDADALGLLVDCHFLA